MSSTTEASTMTASRMQICATAVGAVFLLVGVAGFIPGITTDLDTLEFAGHESEAMLLGVFQVSILHNVVHLLFGIAGLVLARRWETARAYLVGGGLVYAVLWIYGLVVDREHEANFVPLNSADDWLHLALAVGMLALGAGLSKERRGIGSDGPG
jgi:prepilin signal peptidase PulO-like enzyme (type II secretory pathway)